MAAKLGNYLYDMLKSNSKTDVTVVVQGVEIAAHRLVLISRGGLLAELLEDEEKTKFEMNEEISADTFRSVLE